MWHGQRAASVLRWAPPHRWPQAKGPRCGTARGRTPPGGLGHEGLGFGSTRFHPASPAPRPWCPAELSPAPGFQRGQLGPDSRSQHPHPSLQEGARPWSRVGTVGSGGGGSFWKYLLEEPRAEPERANGTRRAWRRILARPLLSQGIFSPGKVNQLLHQEFSLTSPGESSKLRAGICPQGSGGVGGGPSLGTVAPALTHRSGVTLPPPLPQSRSIRGVGRSRKPTSQSPKSCGICHHLVTARDHDHLAPPRVSLPPSCPLAMAWGGPSSGTTSSSTFSPSHAPPPQLFTPV